jgi:hypothetical protein
LKEQRRISRIILAEFSGPDSLLRAARKVREEGYEKFDCHSPFAIHGMDEAMGQKRSNLGFIVGFFALVGLIGAILLQWYASTVAYRLVISGKPFFSYQAYVPVTFALAVLLAAIFSVFGMMALNGLPRLNHPLFSSKRFEKVSDNGFFISVEEIDARFDAEKTPLFLRAIGASDVEVIEA